MSPRFLLIDTCFLPTNINESAPNLAKEFISFIVMTMTTALSDMMDSESPVESTYPAESRGRKRKASTRTGDQATDRKRTQNRISQQCARERQTAYIRQMESFIDLLRSSTEGDTDDTEYTKLLKAHLKLLDDKRNAEESLFRFRQKLLSVGNMATSAAGKPISLFRLKVESMLILRFQRIRYSRASASPPRRRVTRRRRNLTRRLHPQHHHLLWKQCLLLGLEVQPR